MLYICLNEYTMLTFDESLIRAIHIINFKIQHSGYDRTVELAKKYWRLNTGEETGELLKQFNRRESKEAFDQRCALTSTITPAVLSTLNSPFYKAGRSDSITKVARYDDNPDRETELKKFQDSFNGTKSLDDYLSVDLVDLNKTDPNAFVVIDFSAFDAVKERPNPYPLEIPSKNVYNFFYDNNELEFLLKNESISEIGKTEVKERFTLYAREFHAVFTEDDSNVSSINENVVDFNINTDAEIIDRPEYLRTKQGRLYKIEYFNHKFSKVPAFRAGYEMDLVTHKETCVSNWHCTMSWFDKMQQANSEMDISTALHVFPQKISYERGCTGYQGAKCNSGVDINGNQCKACNGTGFVDDHTSGQDVLKFKLPKNADDMMDLSKMAVYLDEPIEVLKFLDDYIDKLQTKTRQTLFNSDSFERKEVVSTATENLLDYDNVYDTLFPFCKHSSFVWMLITEAIARFTDLHEGLILNHEFGNDLKFKTESQYIQDIRTLNDSGAPFFLIEHTNNQLAELIYKDNELELLKIKTKARHMPFSGKTDNEIIFSLSGNNIPRRKKVLYENIDGIFNSFDASFYIKSFDDQEKDIEAKVAEIMLEIDGETINAEGLNLTQDEFETPIDIEAEAKAKLKGSVGGTQGILQIQASVSQGITQYSAALALLGEIYGFDDATSRKILGSKKDIKKVNEAPEAN